MDKEAKVGAMLRHMTADMANGFKEFHRSLYSDDEIGKSACRWHWAIVKYSHNPIEMRGYVSMIQEAYRNKVNLDDIEEWKELMRIIMPEEFLAWMGQFTQVPQIAVRDETEYKKKADSRDSSDIQW